MSLRGRSLGVVFGSRSVEHEISIITACQAMPVLAQLGAEVVPIYITKRGSWITRPEFTELSSFRPRLPEEGDPVLLDLATGAMRVGAGGVFSRPRELSLDALFPILHGTYGEDGDLAGLAALARLPQVGCDVLGSALAMDKLRSRAFFRALGLPVLPARGASRPEEARAAAAELGYPLVVKPNRGGSSIGVQLVSGEGELEAAVELALGFDREVLLEPALLSASDLNCAVKRRPPRVSEVERPESSSGLLSYADKYAAGGKGGSPGAKAAYGGPRRELPARIPAPLRARVQELALAAFDGLAGGGSPRVDFLLSESGELYLNEVNTIPGSLAFHLWEATGVSFPELLEELVSEALEATEERTLSLSENLLGPTKLLGKAGGGG